MVAFTVEFDRPNLTYKPGETMRCIVRLSFSAPTKFRAINVICQGDAQIRWTEQKESIETSVHGTETYFSQSRTLVDAGDGTGGKKHYSLVNHNERKLFCRDCHGTRKLCPQGLLQTPKQKPTSGL